MFIQKWATQTGEPYVDHSFLFIITLRLPKYFNNTYRLDVYFVWLFRATLASQQRTKNSEIGA